MSSISTFGTFTTARLGIYAAQKALDTTGNNIANINTEGYTRQGIKQRSLMLGGADRYASVKDARVGNGAIVTGTAQLRDPYLDIRYRNEMSNVGAMDAKLSGLGDIASVIDEVNGGEDGEGVLEAQFNDLMEQMQNLVTQGAGRDQYDTLVRSSATSLVGKFHSYAKELETLRENQETRMKIDIDTVNNILESISNLNESIRKSNIYGADALEQKDERNLLIDQLSEYVRISVTTEKEHLGAGLIVDKLVIKLKGDDKSNPDCNTATLVDGSYSTRLSIAQVEDDDGNLVDSPNFDINLAELKDSKGRIKKDSEVVELTDTTLYGALQSERELLTEQGEFASKDQLDENHRSYDAEALVKRGYPYYQHALDALAWQFAQMMNEANETAEDKVLSIIEDPSYLLDPNIKDESDLFKKIEESGNYSGTTPITSISDLKLYDKDNNLIDDFAKFKAHLKPGEKLTIKDGGTSVSMPIEDILKSANSGGWGIGKYEQSVPTSTSKSYYKLDPSLTELNIHDRIRALNYKIGEKDITDEHGTVVGKADVYAASLKDLGIEFKNGEYVETLSDLKAVLAEGDAPTEAINLLKKTYKDKDGNEKTLGVLNDKGELETTKRQVYKFDDSINKDNIDTKIAALGLTDDKDDPIETLEDLGLTDGNGRVITNFEVLQYQLQVGGTTLSGSQINKLLLPTYQGGYGLGVCTSAELEVSKGKYELADGLDDATVAGWGLKDENGMPIDTLAKLQDQMVIRDKLTEVQIKVLTPEPDGHGKGKYEDIVGGMLITDGSDALDPGLPDNPTNAQKIGKNITASNIAISAKWASGDVRIITSKEFNPGSTANDNIDHLLSQLMNGKFDFVPSNVYADAYSAPGNHQIENPPGSGILVEDLNYKEPVYFRGTLQGMLSNTWEVLANDQKTTYDMLNNYTASSDELYVNRDAVMGVDLNDEAMNMIQFQKSYSAACRLMTTIDEILDKLINGTGRAGL